MKGPEENYSWKGRMAVMEALSRNLSSHSIMLG